MKLELKELLTISKALNRRKGNIESIPAELREDEDKIELQDIDALLPRVQFEISEQGGS